MRNHQSNSGHANSLTPQGEASEISVALLTGGADRPYAFGLATALIAKGVTFDLIANDELECPELLGQQGLNFLNLRGDQRPDASFIKKLLRVAAYYAELLRYAATAKPKVFHILWNNRFEFFDRTLLMLYYRLLGKKVVLTLHNVNAGARDSNDTWLNRFTLRTQYRLSDHMFVHTEKMKAELVKEFGVGEAQVTVIPFGINNSVPNTNLTSDEARQRLGIGKTEKTILFFGSIAPYKGLEYLVSAFGKVAASHVDYRLIIAGRPKNCEKYWTEIHGTLRRQVPDRRVLLRAEFIPDEETEVYFKAADVLVLPYTHIYQSGVLFLAYSFGLPVLASDVGSLKDDIVEGDTGFVFTPADPDSLAQTIDGYFSSALYQNLNGYRPQIAAFARERNSWNAVADTTVSKYSDLLQVGRTEHTLPSNDPSISLEMKTP
jgi:glycosyltransferase involved in cell wall biosynthesis